MSRVEGLPWWRAWMSLCYFRREGRESRTGDRSLIQELLSSGLYFLREMRGTDGLLISVSQFSINEYKNLCN